MKNQNLTPPKKKKNRLSSAGEKISKSPCLETIIKSLPGSIYWKDRDGTYLGCNDYMLEMAGIADVTGKTDWDLPWKLQAEQIRKNDLEVLNSKIILELEEAAILANGKKAIMLTRKAPLKDEQGNVIGILGMSLDITKSKILEAALKEMKEQTEAANALLQQAKEKAEITLDNIVANMPGHVYWKDRNGVYLGCNNRQAESLGLRYGSDVIGKTDFDLPWAKDVAKAFRENDLRIMSTGVVEVIEEKAQMNGEEATVLSQKTPLKNKKGEIVGILGISVDITDRKQFELELKEAKEKAEVASKVKTEFLENMRHDIRTPLTGITGFASIISHEVNDPQIKQYVDALNTSSYALLDLLNEILDVIKLNSGDIPLLKRKFNLQKRLADVIALNLAKAHQKNINLQFDYDKKIPPYLIGDPTRIHRIALELIANALNFTDHGSVQLSTQLGRIEDHDIIIKLIINDTGIGIAPEKQQEIFLQFKRLTPSYEGIYKGAGLGLAIVKQFIDDLQGEIYVESKINEGTKFTCIIPLKKSLLDEELGNEETIIHNDLRESDIIAAKHLDEPTNLYQNTLQNHILVVEDNVIAATVASSMLSTLNCQIDLAENGKKAVELAQENKYDLIFMDIGLPEIDGYEATRRIRLHELNKGGHVPIIALTAHVDEESKQRCLEVGMNAVLTKPITKDKLQDTLDSFIPYRKEQLQNQNKEKPSDEINIPKPREKVIDFNLAMKQLDNNKQTLTGLLKILAKELPLDLKQLEASYKNQDWLAVQHIAHKLKGSSCYVGAIRLNELCSSLELAIKKQERKLSGNLCEEMFKEMQAVIKAVKINEGENG